MEESLTQAAHIHQNCLILYTYIVIIVIYLNKLVALSIFLFYQIKKWRLIIRTIKKLFFFDKICFRKAHQIKILSYRFVLNIKAILLPDHKPVFLLFVIFYIPNDLCIFIH